MKHRKVIITIISLFVFTINSSALTKAPIDITNMDISEIREALDLKIITVQQLVNLYLERIEMYDDDYKSIISINENAIKEAEALDKELNENKIRSNLHGIPVVVKDNIDVVGMKTTAGARSLSDNYPKENSPAIQKLIDAGAIIIAKANMSEFAFSARTSNSSYGQVRNAYNTKYTPYGSSGGTAVAVALSFAAAGLGTDTNSSVRLPASANNLVGLRPTTGLISRLGTLPYDPERDTIGTITKTAKDAMILLNILNGYDKNDSKSINQKQITYEKNLKDLSEITIGIPKDFMYGSNDNSMYQNRKTYSEITSLMEKAVENLKAKGAKIVYIDKYYNSKTDHWVSSSLSGYLFCSSFNIYIKNTSSSIRSFNELANSYGLTTNLEGYTSSCASNSIQNDKLETKEEYTTYLIDIMKKNKVDVIAYPSTKNKLSLFNDESTLNNLSSHASSTVDFPSITVQLGFDKEDLPYGIEFMTNKNDENNLLNIAIIYEENYIDFKSPNNSPSLYEISEEMKLLIENYKEISTKKQNRKEKQITLKTKKLLQKYNNNEKVDSEITLLNKEYNKLNRSIIGSKTLILLSTLFSLFIVRKFYTKKIKI